MPHGPARSPLLSCGLLALTCAGGCPEPDYTAKAPVLSAPIFRPPTSEQERINAEALAAKLAESALAVDFCDGCTAGQRAEHEANFARARDASVFPRTAADLLPVYPSADMDRGAFFDASTTALSHNDRLAAISGSGEFVGGDLGQYNDGVGRWDIVTIYDLDPGGAYTPTLTWRIPPEHRLCSPAPGAPIIPQGMSMIRPWGGGWVGEEYLLATLFCGGSVLLNANTGETRFLVDSFASAAVDSSGLYLFQAGALERPDGSVTPLLDDTYCQLFSTNYAGCIATGEVTSLKSGKPYPFAWGTNALWSGSGFRRAVADSQHGPLVITDFAHEPPLEWTIELPTREYFVLADWRTDDRWLVAEIGYPGDRRGYLFSIRIHSPILIDVEERVIYQIAEDQVAPVLRRLR